VIEQRQQQRSRTAEKKPQQQNITVAVTFRKKTHKKQRKEKVCADRNF